MPNVPNWWDQEPVYTGHGIGAWYGPYTIQFDTEGLVDPIGIKLFTPVIDEWLQTIRIVPYVYLDSDDEDQPTWLELGTWASDSPVDILPNDATLDVGGGNDPARLATVTDQGVYNNNPDIQIGLKFATTDPVYIRNTNTAGLNAGHLDIYFLLESPSVIR